MYAAAAAATTTAAASVCRPEGALNTLLNVPVHCNRMAIVKVESNLGGGNHQ